MSLQESCKGLAFEFLGFEIYGPFPIFRGPAERVYLQTLSLHPDCASLFCFKARDKTVPRTVLFIQVPDVFIILFDGAVR